MILLKCTPYQGIPTEPRKPATSSSIKCWKASSISSADSWGSALREDPPRRPKRFDARFFAVDAEAIAHRTEGVVGPDSELTELVWIPLPEAKTLDLPTITRIVLAELGDRIAGGFGRHLPAPHYFEQRRKWIRLEL